MAIKMKNYYDQSKSIKVPDLTEEQKELVEIESWKLQRILNVLSFYTWSPIKLSIDHKTYTFEKCEELCRDLGKKADETITLIREHLESLDANSNSQ